MAGVEQFEDLEAWKLARELNRAIYGITSEGTFARDFALRDQIGRAGISVMSNISEGFERGGNSEFKQFLYISKGSVGEVRAQLYIALDAGYIDEPAFQTLYDLTKHTGRLISGLIRYLENSDFKGSKYR